MANAVTADEMNVRNILAVERRTNAFVLVMIPLRGHPLRYHESANPFWSRACYLHAPWGLLLAVLAGLAFSHILFRRAATDCTNRLSHHRDGW